MAVDKVIAPVLHYVAKPRQCTYTCNSSPSNLPTARSVTVFVDKMAVYLRFKCWSQLHAKQWFSTVYDARGTRLGQLPAVIY